jgi:zinc protease
MNTLRYILTIIFFAGIIMTNINCAKGPEVTELLQADSPLITFRIEIKAGSINDPAGKEGLNALTALTIGQGGTKELTYQQVLDKLYPWAANINPQVDKEVTIFIGEVHKDHLDQFYKIFTDRLLNPRFDEADFTRNKDLIINHLENTLRGTDDENLGKQALSTFMYDNHPYRISEVGTVQGLKSITLEDIKNFHKRVYTKDNIKVGIAGGYSKSILEKIKEDFGKLPSGKIDEVKLPDPGAILNMEIMFVEKPARGTAISMGFPITLTRKDRDYYALMLANSYFGEHRTFNGVLMNSLRGDRGLNYGDYSYVEQWIQDGGSTFQLPNTPRHQQYFSIWIRPVQPENAHFAVRNAMYELKNLVEKGLTEEQFEATRKYLINYSKLWVQTTSRRLGYQMDSEFYGTEFFIDKIEKELKVLRLADVNNAIKKYLNSTNIKVAVVCNDAKTLQDAMFSNAPSHIKYASPVAQKILDEDKIIEVFPLEINKEKSKIVPVKELFEK